MRRTLEGGESSAIVPGGVKEVVWAGRVDRERLYLKNVFGFCKLALQTGCPLVPVYTFGESLSMVRFLRFSNFHFKDFYVLLCGMGFSHC